MPDMSPEACAARGATFLDDHRPGWHDEIDTAKLDMATGFVDEDTDGAGCVLCQLAGSYSDGLARFEVDAPALHGFILPSFAGPYSSHSKRWSHLEDAWIAEVMKRRTPARSGVSARAYSGL